MGGGDWFFFNDYEGVNITEPFSHCYEENSTLLVNTCLTRTCKQRTLRPWGKISSFGFWATFPGINELLRESDVADYRKVITWGIRGFACWYRDTQSPLMSIKWLYKSWWLQSCGALAMSGSFPFQIWVKGGPAKWLTDPQEVSDTTRNRTQTSQQLVPCFNHNARHLLPILH